MITYGADGLYFFYHKTNKKTQTFNTIYAVTHNTTSVIMHAYMYSKLEDKLRNILHIVSFVKRTSKLKTTNRIKNP